MTFGLPISLVPLLRLGFQVGLVTQAFPCDLFCVDRAEEAQVFWHLGLESMMDQHCVIFYSVDRLTPLFPNPLKVVLGVLEYLGVWPCEFPTDPPKYSFFRGLIWPVVS